MELKNKRIAMLIDADNAQASLLSQTIDETAKYGRVTIKRIYGDWTTPSMKSWKEELNTYAVRPIQKFAYTKGKNSTDIALVIDAMDIMHSKEVDGFCLVSSDSDFTGLANRIRESGLFVIGIGKEQTPKPFINACDIFTFTENFDSSKPATNHKKPALNIKLIRKAYGMVEQDNGTAFLSQLSEAIRKLDSSFDPRTYGYKNYVVLFKDQTQDFEVVSHPDNSTVSVKDIRNN